MVRSSFIFTLLVFPWLASAGSPATALKRLPNVSFPAAHRIASGRLQARDIPALRKAGVREVIDLSADSETPHFDEAKAVRRAGIEYHNLPIRGANDLDDANVARFDRFLTEAGDKEVLVHCASSNRVGALIALRAAIIQGKSDQAAIAEGRSWGLKGLEPAVRERLAARAKATPVTRGAH